MTLFGHPVLFEGFHGRVVAASSMTPARLCLGLMSPSRSARRPPNCSRPVMALESPDGSHGQRQFGFLLARREGDFGRSLMLWHKTRNLRLHIAFVLWRISKMATSLTPIVVANILELRRAGISIREISRRLGVNRETVSKYLGKREIQTPKVDGESDIVDTAISRSSTKRTGTRSRCEPFRELIIERVNQGLTAQQIFQFLVSEQGFKARYYSVRRFVAKLQAEKRDSSTAAIVAPSTPANTIR